jgi:hypothetical protein
MWHNDEPKKLELITKHIGSKTRGYLIREQVGRTLLERTSMASKLETFWKVVQDLIKNFLFDTMRLFCLVHKLGWMKIFNPKNVWRNFNSFKKRKVQMVGLLAFLRG